MARRKPSRIVVDRVAFEAVVLKVLERDTVGRPLRLEVVHQDEKVQLQEGDAFIIAYVRSAELQPETGN